MKKKFSMTVLALGATTALQAQALPTITINGNLLPCISHNVHTAMNNGLPGILQRDTLNMHSKRSKSCGRISLNLADLNADDDRVYGCNAYPFATANAGGAGAQVMFIPLNEKQTFQSLMDTFYQQHRVKHGDHFKVVVVFPANRVRNLVTTSIPSASVPGMVMKCH